MDVKCVTCTRKFIDIHALKSHQPKCRFRADAHFHGFRKLKRERREAKRKNSSGQKLAKGMDVTEEELALERQEIRERDKSEPARKRKNQPQVGATQ
jgi:hypothetical protein